MVDFAELDTSRLEADMPVLHPGTRLPTGAVIRFRVIDHEDVITDIRKPLQEVLQSLGKSEADKDTINSMARTCAAALVSWQNVELDGKPVKADKASAYAFFSSPRTTWLLPDCVNFITDRRNFFRASSKG